MPRVDLDVNLDRVEVLTKEMTKFVPITAIEAGEFRADLAGLLVVSIAACYENCVKEILVSHATRNHSDFGLFVHKNYKKLNSKISVSDLHKYADLFGNDIHDKFKASLSNRKEKIYKRIGKNIENSYQQILSWRHDFAHSWKKNTTIEEAISTHRLAKRVLYSFDEAFNGK